MHGGAQRRVEWMRCGVLVGILAVALVAPQGVWARYHECSEDSNYSTTHLSQRPPAMPEA
jgi:hypothetical protein